ncbi:MAG: phenylalanine--tRNA ligase subunit beta [Cyanobacteria bacterium SZAS-4]|nr:phenylalanine--tRNA ligase subunit beta [Cyanobacteria bacterium SZAS-4]
MRLSFDWLSEYVDLTGITPEMVAEKLTMGAFEVEEIRKVGPDIEGPVVLGEILEILPHPNADKIRLTKTRIAPGADPLEIVCGAQNIEVGQRIPVALPGAKVINRKDGTALVIKASAIRGVQSNGMLCSPPELGIVPAGVETPESSGILILNKSHGELGADIKELFHLYPDHVLIVEPRSNRGDSLSVIGLAREVAALLNRPLKRPDWKLDVSEDAALNFDVAVENTDDCPFFTIRRLSGLKVGPSPNLISRRLEAVGVRSINNIVDVTNYVMHEYGQPLHAYDMSKLDKAEITVRRARPDEKMVTLDSKERTMNNEVLVITNGDKSVGVAGVMGGENTEISDSTTDVALESATFNQARVRRGGRLLGLASESSLRFERGVDVGSTAEASDRATYLFLKYCSGDSTPKVGKLEKAGSDDTKKVSIDLRLGQLKRFLDAEFTVEQVTEYLTPLGFQVSKKDDKVVSVSVPSFRQSDVTREIDIVEEVCRIWGYDNLPVRMPRGSVTADPAEDTVSKARSILVSAGLSEAWLSSLTAADVNPATASYSTQNPDTIVKVNNPLSEDHQVLRQSLMPGLIKCAAYNQDHGRKDVWIFEIGRTYSRLAPGEEDIFKTGVKEELKVAGVLMGDRDMTSWKGTETVDADFYTAKGVVENLLGGLGIDLKRTRFFNPKETNILHPSRSAQIEFDRGASKKEKDNNNNNNNHQQQNQKSQTEHIGHIGQVHPGFSDAMGLKQPAFLFELSLDNLRGLRKANSFKEIPTAPETSRDLTIDLDERVDHAAVTSCITAAAGQILKQIELVSIYQPAEGKRSLSYRLSFQDIQRTLTNEEVETSLTKIRESLVNRLGASFRL